VLVAVAAFAANPNSAFSQLRSNNTGNGGINSIRGRVYLPNGRIFENSVKVELQSTNQPTQSVYTDNNGAFAFNGLTAGSYTIVVEAGEPFEVAHEYALIDRELSGAGLAAVPKIQTIPVYLRLKNAHSRLDNRVLNAKWSAVPQEALQHFKKGLELADAGKDSEAEAEFRKTIEIAPNFAPAHTQIGTLELRAQRPEAAVEPFKNAIRYDANDFSANLNLGIAYYNLRRFDEAETSLVSAAYIDRFAVTPHYYLGMIFAAKNDFDVAQKAFEKVEELNGGNALPVIHKYLGRIYIHKQMAKRAVDEFEVYLKLLPAAKDADAIKKEIAEIKGTSKKSQLVD